VAVAAVERATRRRSRIGFTGTLEAGSGGGQTCGPNPHRRRHRQNLTPEQALGWLNGATWFEKFRPKVHIGRSHRRVSLEALKAIGI
jgi:hypothetical protein